MLFVLHLSASWAAFIRIELNLCRSVLIEPASEHCSISWKVSNICVCMMGKFIALWYNSLLCSFHLNVWGRSCKFNCLLLLLGVGLLVNIESKIIQWSEIVPRY